jgi:glyoxylase-like metal-dependent hydrolase (beta-lactamase superfamily II)
MWTWQFGDTRIAVISEATGWWPIERALIGVPENVWRREIPTNADDRLEIGFNLLHISRPGASILVDTGFGEYDPTDRENPIVSVRDVRLGEGLEANLRRLGVGSEDISYIAITHMHGDHILGATRTVDGRRVPAFPNARYVVAATEWAAAPEFHQNGPAIEAQKEALLAAGVVELVEGEREIALGVSLIPAPGESPGHQIVRIADGHDVVYFLGDLFHYPAEFGHLDWIPRYRDRVTLVATREKLLPRFVDEDAWLIPAHHRFPGIGKVWQSEAGYEWVEEQPDRE